MTSQRFCDYCDLPVTLRRESDEGPVYCCFGCSLAAEITQARGDRGRVTELAARLGVAVFLSMIVMTCSIFLFGKDVSGEEAALADSLESLAKYGQLILTAPVIYLLGFRIWENAIAQLRNGAFAIDVLIMIGTGAAFALSVYSTFTESGQTYYETICMVLVFVTLGRGLEAAGRLKASDAVKSLERLIPDSVTKIVDNHEMTVPVGELQIADRLRLRAGETIPVDCTIEKGDADIDERLITGESQPVTRGPGDALASGTNNLNGDLFVRVSAVAKDSTVARLVKLLDEAKRTKGRYARLADRIIPGFIVATIIVAAIAFAHGFRAAGIGQGVMQSLSVLLIACPCALGIATPMAVWLALGKAARAGMLFRNGDAIERLATVRAVAFDKTGTLTTGQTRIDRMIDHRDTDTNDATLGLQFAAGLASGSLHSVSRGICDFASSRSVKPASFDAIRSIPGRGLIGENGVGVVALGNAELMHETGMTINTSAINTLAQIADESLGVACLAWNGRVQLVFALNESLRPEAKSAIESLKASRIHAIVLTGDNESRGRAVADELSIPVRAGLKPEDKVAAVEEIRAKYGPTAMVGDGLNDAPVLAAADVGIAMGCGADIAREAGDICLLGNQLDMIPIAVRLARSTVRAIRLNLFWAFAFNIVGMGLAVTGRLNPILAAAAMAVSSVFVIANSLRLASFTMSFNEMKSND